MIGHDALAESLAAHLHGPHRMTWCDLQLGPSGSVRPDVYTIEKSFVRPNPMAYECKVSLSDFRCDVTSGKWQAYLQYASGVYFACEAGLIGKTDVPEMCGLVVLKDGAWRSAKRPTIQPVTIPQDAFLKLLIDGIEREGAVQRTKKLADQWVYLTKIKHKFGEVVTKVVSDRVAVETEIESAQRSAKRIVEDAQQRAEQLKQDAAEHIGPLRSELCEILGLKPDADRWTLQGAVKRLREAQQEHPAQRKLKRLTMALEHAISMHGIKESSSEIEA